MGWVEMKVPLILVVSTGKQPSSSGLSKNPLININSEIVERGLL